MRNLIKLILFIALTVNVFGVANQYKINKQSSTDVPQLHTFVPGDGTVFTFQGAERAAVPVSYGSLRQLMGVPVFETSDPGATDLFPIWNDSLNQMDWVNAANYVSALNIDFSGITGDPYSNTNLATALNSKSNLAVSTNAQIDNYTLVASDSGKVIEITKETANTLTIPLNSAVAFPVGTRIYLKQGGAGAMSITATGGVTLVQRSGTLVIGAAGHLAVLLKTATDTWDVTTARLDAISAGAPTVNEDTLDGYSFGSLWRATTASAVYICLDNTAGAAVWERLDRNGITFSNLDTALIIDSSETIDSNNNNTSIPTSAAVKSKVDAKVVDAINDGATTTAPSENAVFDALALKAASSSVLPAANAAEVNAGTENGKSITPFALAGSGLPRDVNIADNTLVSPMYYPEWFTFMSTSYDLLPREVLPFYAADANSIYNLHYFKPETSFPSAAHVGTMFVAPNGSTSVTATVDARTVTGTKNAQLTINTANTGASNLAGNSPALTTTPQTFTLNYASTPSAPGTNLTVMWFANPNGSNGSTSGSFAHYAGNLRVFPVGVSTGVFASDFIRIEPRGVMTETRTGPLGTVSSGNTVLNSVGYQSPFAQLHVRTDATTAEVEVVGGATAPNDKLLIWVDGKPYTEIDLTNTALGIYPVTLPAGMKTVSFVGGPQMAGSASDAPNGVYLRAVYLPKKGSTQIIRPPAAARRAVIYTDSLGTSLETATTSGHYRGLMPLVFRQLFPGSVRVEGWGSRALYDDANAVNGGSASLDRLVDHILEDNPTDFIDLIGTNDYGLQRQSSTNFGIMIGRLYDKLIARSPNIRIWSVGMFTRASEVQLNAADGGWGTLGAYRTAKQTEAAKRRNCYYIDGSVANASSGDNGADGIHFTIDGATRVARWLNDQMGMATRTARPTTGVTPISLANTIPANDIDWSLGVNHVQTLSTNRAFTFSNDSDGKSITVAITNTASNYTVDWPGGILWSGGTEPTQTVGAKTDIYTFKRIGSVIYGSVIQNF